MCVWFPSFNNLAYVADLASGLRILNVSTPSSPVEVGFYDTLGSARSLAVSGPFVYVADDFAGMEIFRSCHIFLDGFESGDLSAWSSTLP